MENYLTDNEESRKRLETLIAQLSDADLLRANANGWTVASLLAHLAFWDQRAILLIQRWQATGVQPSPVDSDIINDTVLPFLLNLPSRKVCQLTIEMAKTVDSKVSALTPVFVNDILKNAKQFRLDRAKHRNEHILEIERLLAN